MSCVHMWCTRCVLIACQLVFMQIGALGKFPTNSKDIEGTLARRWLLYSALQTQDVELENIVTPTGDRHTLTVREAIQQHLIPDSHVTILKTLVAKPMRGELNQDDELNAPAHPDEFYQTSVLNPLRRLLPPCSLFLTFDVAFAPASVDTAPFSKAILSFGRFAYPMASLHGCATYRAPAGTELTSQLTDAARMAYGNARLWPTIFASSNTSLHSSVSLTQFPALTRAAGGAPVPLRVGRLSVDHDVTGATIGDREVDGDRQGVVCCSASGLYRSQAQPWQDEVRLPQNTFSIQDLRLALQDHLLRPHARYRDAEHVCDNANLKVFNISEVRHRCCCGLFQQSLFTLFALFIFFTNQVYFIKQYTVGRELFSSAQLKNDSRSHALVPCRAC